RTRPPRPPPARTIRPGRTGADPRRAPPNDGEAVVHRMAFGGSVGRTLDWDLSFYRLVYGRCSGSLLMGRIRTVGPACRPAPELSGGPSPISTHGRGVARQPAG